MNNLFCQLSGLVKLFCLFLLIQCIGYLSCGREEIPKSYFPETGENALHQRALDLKNNIAVLSISLQPGYENLSALAYLRLGNGATIMSAYVTNGEAGENDQKIEYPPYLAATRRREAFKALSLLDGEIYYLNLPDIAAARNEAKCREMWFGNLLQIKLEKLISQFRPNIILVCRDWVAPDNSPRSKVLLKDILAVVKKMAAQDTTKRLSNNKELVWSVDRVFIDNNDQPGLCLPVYQNHPKWNKTYQEIGEEAASLYASLAHQRNIWFKQDRPKYQQVYPNIHPAISVIDEELVTVCSPRLQSLDKKIKQLAKTVLESSTEVALEQLVLVKDSVNYFLTRKYDLKTNETKILSKWNFHLENLHNTLLGVRVKYTLSDTLLTVRQLAYLTIDDVSVLKNNEKTNVYFTSPDVDWVINEKWRKELPLKLHEEYRLFTTQDLVYTRPPGTFKFESSQFGSPLFFYIIHNDSLKKNRFIHRTKLNFEFAPQFMVEVLTPIVRLMTGEKVIVRLTNLSRDGVADTIKVSDPQFSSAPRAFSLKTKESSIVDTLYFWAKDNLDKGSYLVPLTIGDRSYGNFVVRNFDAQIDTAKKVGIVTSYAQSPIENTLRRLAVEPVIVTLNRTFSKQIESLNVLIIDRRLLTLQPQITEYKEEIHDFINNGGHLLILAQDASSWNANPLWEGMFMSSTLQNDQDISLNIDSTHSILTSPNLIGQFDWDGWLFLRGYNVVSCEDLNVTKFPVKAKENDSPLIVTTPQGKGKLTYVDLALTPQLMNVHPGAFRIFANIVSY